MQLKKDGNSLYVSKIKIVMELHLLNLPPNDEFDIDITQIFSRENTKTTKKCRL